MRVSAIVAMAQNHVLGKDNQLPWKLPADLKHFRQITTGHPIIMGRKTFESIGRVLPDRQNIIVTRQSGYAVPGAHTVSSIEQALQVADDTNGEVFVIGGSQIYQAAANHIERIYLTLINQDFSGDAFFSSAILDQFEQISREDHKEPFSFSFLILDRRQ